MLLEIIKNPVIVIGQIISDWLRGFLPAWLVGLIMNFVAIIAILGFLIITVMALTYIERKIVSRIADRIGPNRTGPFGIFQPIADTLKLLIKEDTTPAWADRWVFLLAPAVISFAALIAYSILPFGPGMVGTDINIGVIFVVAFGSLTTVAILMAGWGGRNKYSLLGGMRAVAQMVSYEVPMVLAMLGPVMLVGSMSLVDIVKAQSGVRWLILAQPIGFLIYFIAGIAETNRSPFDIPEAESELVAGFHIEYSGIKFALFFLAEYINMFTVSAMATVLFLGGWRGPFAEQVPILGFLYFIIKVYIVIFLFVWFRGTFPRLRVDQLMDFAWKFLVPLALVNLFLTGLLSKIPMDGKARTVVLFIAGLLLIGVVLWGVSQADRSRKAGKLAT
ncbi:MAG: NADH-quinone oxidoreductase subunit NuoH [Anaerolineae bacterium]